ncbi:BRCT domain-containing protein [Abeliophyllum distichum]|uniref:BRCT domain-containing protein n=1 Tax=Abeliophyllum distichum TaxID=126358 RepID=A0ABD1VDF1_9LAMI
MENNLNVDLINPATQLVEGRVFKGDHVDEFLHLPNTIDDTFFLGDAFETQLMNLAGETQVLDPVGETQVLDPVGETQMLDRVGETQVLDCVGETQVLDCVGETQVLDPVGETQVLDDPDCMEEIMHTQLVEECTFEGAAGSDDEGTDRTQVLCETHEFSDYESIQRDGDFPVFQENKVDTDRCEQGDDVRKTPSDILSNVENHSGSGHRGFTSLRAASIRASGLAARMKASQGINGKSYSSKSEDSSLDHQPVLQDGMPLMRNTPKSGREINGEHFLKEYNEDGKESRNENRFKVGSTTVRKLFTEDRVDEVRQSDAGHEHTDDTAKLLLASENCLAGLSYANSQEPGELSQANALEVVDRFLTLNVDQYDKKFDSGTAPRKKPDVVSREKGTRRLATSVSLKSMDGEHGIYDWDDNREDEGGGEFFLKKKELFFTEPRKSRNHWNKEQQPENNKKLAGLVCSDSKLMLHKPRAKGQSLKHKKGKFPKNLTANLNEQLNVASGDKLGDDNDANKDVLDMVSIGPDTQMAAEAMETLCFELHLADSNGDGSNQGAQNTRIDNCKNHASNRVTHPEQDFGRRRTRSSNAGAVTRQTNPTKRTSAKISDAEPGKVDQRRAESRDIVASCGKVCSSTLAPKIVEQKKERRTRKRSSIEIDGCLSTESARRMSQKKCRLQEQLGSFTPVAHRTRKYRDLNTSNAAGNCSVDSRGEINDLMSGRILRRSRTASTRGKSAKMGGIEKLGEVRSVGDKQSDTKCSGTSGALGTDALGYLRGGRTHLKFPIVAQEADATDCNSVHLTERASVDDGVKAKRFKQSNGKGDAEIRRTAEEANGSVETSPREKNPISASACTPVTCTTPINNASPICMGDEYHKQSCRKNLSKFSLMKEVNSLISSAPRTSSPTKDSRKRRDVTNVRALFSHHLDSDVIKQQQKILAQLGASVASSMLDATHFVADEFVRTRNMLEAIAFGKPVVTHLWLECCGQASCLIDERNYILRDVRKEKEFGFSMPVSLARACQHPLLQGQRVFVTQNTKPGKDILSSLVKAVHGLAIERLGRSALKDEKLPDDLLILSCEEDYDICVPFLEKGAAVYSSELLLNGIVTQKLEYERHRLFADNVKRTRSTIWVKKKNQYLPVTK